MPSQRGLAVSLGIAAVLAVWIGIPDVSTRESAKPAEGVPAVRLAEKSKFTCSVRKTRCAQMESCDEAFFYLTQCGVRSLDRDKDGVPCESLCN